MDDASERGNCFQSSFGSLYCTFFKLLLDYLGKKLENYVANLPVKTFVLRTEKRSGLIRARLLGAKHVAVNNLIFKYSRLS